MLLRIQKNQSHRYQGAPHKHKHLKRPHTSPFTHTSHISHIHISHTSHITHAHTTPARCSSQTQTLEMSSPQHITFHTSHIHISHTCTHHICTHYPGKVLLPINKHKNLEMSLRVSTKYTYILYTQIHSKTAYLTHVLYQCCNVWNLIPEMFLERVGGSRT